MLFYKPPNYSDLESTCDAALIDRNTVYFIELKERTSKGWLSKASSQIINTIELYRTTDGNHANYTIIGQVCNSLKPKASVSHMQEIYKFNKATGGCKLIVQQEVNIP